MTAGPQHPELLHAIFWGINALALLLAAVALAWGVAMVKVFKRDGHRQRNGLCLRCGYDLRQTPDRCPECGEPVQAVGRKGGG